MRIVAGTLRGRTLAAPSGPSTRPTADRVRQAVFDMLAHAEWGGRTLLEGAAVLDAFAGTGAMGLEALSRGAGHATFMENDRAALAPLRANIGSCRAESRSTVLAVDVLAAPRAPAPANLVFLDPPYGRELVPRAIAQLTATGWIAPGSVIVAEVGRAETCTPLGAAILADRLHGAARIATWRA
jgi:16S rRNA (guanine966-N2)-methyltransferase